MTQSKTPLFDISKDRAKALVILAFYAGEQSGKAKELTSILMSSVGRGVIAEMKGIDANSVLCQYTDCNLDYINQMSLDAIKTMNKIYLELGNESFFENYDAK